MSVAITETNNAVIVTKRRLLGTASASAILIGVLVGANLAIVQPVLAAQAAAATQELDEVVVTGTAIVRDGFQAPTPITVVSTEEILRQGAVNIADVAHKIPALTNSNSAHNSGHNLSDGNAGSSNMNLRSLGAIRTLVLLDGVRIVNANVSGFFGGGAATDTNVFPDQLISRIDVVTGGASAVYGSDALSGVVNFVLDKTFTGVKGSVQGGLTTYGDNPQYSVNLAAGTPFSNGLGHFLISASHNWTGGEKDAGQVREQWAESHGRITNAAYTPTNGQPFYLYGKNIGSMVNIPGGLITSGPLKGTAFGPGGVPYTFTYGVQQGTPFMMGGDYQVGLCSTLQGYGPCTSLSARLSRENLFTRVSYDITDSIQLYAQNIYSETASTSYCCVGFTTATITSGNPFIPAEIQARMTAGAITSLAIGDGFQDEIGPTGNHNERRFNQYLVGATGKFGALETDWSWNAYLTRSFMRNNNNSIGNVNVTRYRLAVDAVRHPTTGAIVCRSTLTNPNNGCVPHNPFGIGVNSQPSIDYIANDTFLKIKMRQQIAAATLSGDPFSTWAGPVSVAFGFAHRQETSTGFSENEANDHWTANYRATIGAYKITEGSAETVIPLAKAEPWADSLELNGAVRLTDYSTSGLVTTWKVGAVYEPYSDMRIRATRSRDIRAPNIGELFSAGQSGSTALIDPERGNTAVPTISVTQGNPNLKPEKADAVGLGVVYQPSWAPGLSASVDFFDIDVKDVITSVGAQTVLRRCSTERLPEFCSLVQRDAAGNLITVYSSGVNTAFLKQSGLDLELSYRTFLSDLFDGLDGSVNTRFVAQRTLKYKASDSEGRVQSNLGENTDGNGSPFWSWNVQIVYDRDNYAIGWTARGISAGVHSNDFTECTSACPNLVAPLYTVNDNSLPGTFYMDLNFTYRFDIADTVNSEAFMAVTNIMDKWPSRWPFSSGSPASYDLIGRTVRAGLRFKY